MTTAKQAIESVMDDNAQRAIQQLVHIHKMVHQPGKLGENFIIGLNQEFSDSWDMWSIRFPHTNDSNHMNHQLDLLVDCVMDMRRLLGTHSGYKDWEVVADMMGRLEEKKALILANVDTAIARVLKGFDMTAYLDFCVANDIEIDWL